MAQYSPEIHPDIKQIALEIEQRLSKTYEPVREAHNWARENLGEFAAQYVAGDKPEYRANAKRYAQAVFDMTVPDPDNPIDMALTLLPAFTEVEALGKIARGTLEATGTRLPRHFVKELVERPTSTIQSRIWEALRGPKAERSMADWGYDPKEVQFLKDRFGRETLNYTPGQVIFPPYSLAEAGMPGSQVVREEIAKYGLDAPLRRHQFGLGHELTHGIADEMTTSDYARLFGFSPTEDWGQLYNQMLPNLMEDYADLQRSGLYVPPALRDIKAHVPYSWKGAPRPGEETLADLGGLYTIGHPVGKTLSRTIKNPEPLLQYMNLDELRRLAGK